ncbi:Nucleolar pre-ribosomal-associated protein 1, partial [Geodia barretti]
MKKRKRKEVEEGEINQESESRGSSKKAKIGVDPLKKFLSLVELVTVLQSQSDSGSGMGQSPGHKLVGAILRDHMRPLYSALMTSCPMRLVGACLRLLTAMVMQGHTAARDVQQTFNFAYKPLLVFPNRTNRIKGTSDSVRTCFVKFALSFLIAGDNDVIRNILQLKIPVVSVQTAPRGSSGMVHLFLSTLREKVLRNSRVSKRAKSALFNHYALKQLSCLLSLTGPGGETMGAGGPGKRERRGEELEMVSEGSGEVVVISLRDYVLEVLTELCTSFQLGVCYRTKTDSLLAGRTNNSAILQLLLSFTGSLCEPGVQSLVSEAIATCPDLLTPYLGAVGVSFEPRPNSKWIDNVDFLNRLVCGLPPVPETLGIIGGCGHEVPTSLVPAAVSLTVPAAISRSFLNQGIQILATHVSGVLDLEPSPLVRLKTLDLIRGILKRAVATAASLSALGPSIPPGLGSGTGATCGEMSPSASIGPTVTTTYSDSVLKLLPELKTLVNLRQTLCQGMACGVSAASSLEQAKASDSFSPQHRLDNAGLLEDPSGLLTGCLEVMRGYQTLSPSQFLQADFNPVRLLPSLAHLATDRATPVPPSVLTATLRLLEEIPSDLFKWQQQKSGVLSSLLWLVVCDGRDIHDVALRLTLKLLLSVECFSQLEVELGLVLTAARRFTDLCLPER